MGDLWLWYPQRKDNIAFYALFDGRADNVAFSTESEVQDDAQGLGFGIIQADHWNPTGLA